MAEQISFFDEPKREPDKLAKPMFRWSIYAVPKYYDGMHIEIVISAYTERQARFLFYKNHSEYRITDVYRI